MAIKRQKVHKICVNMNNEEKKRSYFTLNSIWPNMTMTAIQSFIHDCPPRFWNTNPVLRDILHHCPKHTHLGGMDSLDYHVDFFSQASLNVMFSVLEILPHHSQYFHGIIPVLATF